MLCCCCNCFRWQRWKCLDVGAALKQHRTGRYYAMCMSLGSVGDSTALKKEDSVFQKLFNSHAEVLLR